MSDDWYRERAIRLRATTPFHTGEVHAQDTSALDQFATYELLGETLQFDVPLGVDDWAKMTGPNLPWADEHFGERVSGKPLNPAPSHERWPFAQKNNQKHVDSQGKFSHTYPERFWPRFAGDEWRQEHKVPMGGLRYQYGDLKDVVDLLCRNPYTRQAYLPVWFPEDLTAAVISKRVPCTIGYHFMIRDGRVHCWYTMRSCDFVRYLRDDVYMAGRLMQWVAAGVASEIGTHPGVYEDQSPVPGTLHLTISSLHAFVGDQWVLDRVIKG